MKTGLIHSIAWLSLACAATEGHEEVLFNQVYVEASVEREIANDEMQVVLAAEQQGSDPADLASRVNRDMAWALRTAQDQHKTMASTRSYQTWPVYKNRDVVGWRVSQELVLKSTDSAALSKLTGLLQQRLQVRHMGFSVTRATRDQFENELIEECMQAFKRRVAVIQKHMNQPSHRIVSLHVNTGGDRPAVVHARRSQPRMAAMEIDAPAVESGTSTVTVTITGSVQFF